MVFSEQVLYQITPKNKVYKAVKKLKEDVATEKYALQEYLASTDKAMFTIQDECYRINDKCVAEYKINLAVTSDAPTQDWTIRMLREDYDKKRNQITQIQEKQRTCRNEWEHRIKGLESTLQCAVLDAMMQDDDFPWHLRMQLVREGWKLTDELSVVVDPIL